VQRAEGEARRLRGAQVEPEHLLLALLRDDRSAGAFLVATRGNLANGRLDLGRVITRLEDVDRALRQETPSALVPSPRLRRVFTLATDEAARLEDERIGTGHLLLGVIAEAGPAADVLDSFGVDRARVGAALAQIHPYDEDEPDWIERVHPT
jgi:ATP-dependent Clp protease ATP-binding subunit ClpA